MQVVSRAAHEGRIGRQGQAEQGPRKARQSVPLAQQPKGQDRRGHDSGLRDIQRLRLGKKPIEREQEVKDRREVDCKVGQQVVAFQRGQHPSGLGHGVEHLSEQAEVKA